MILGFLGILLGLEMASSKIALEIFGYLMELIGIM
jgi:hypothetical protein